MSQATFRTLRDPRPGARLPFLLCLPVAGEAELVLACAVSWPGARDAYCRQLERCPPDSELVEEVPVDGCWRSGASVHLVLGRRDRRRSLFVWTSGRSGRTVYWRTQKTMTAARPGMRVPAARGLDRPLDIAMDQRERYAWKFTKQRANVERRLLPVGDYGVFTDDRLVAVVERKTPANLAADAISGALAFALAELERLPSACMVVEGRLSDVLAAAEGYVKPGWLLSVLAALQVAHPRVSWVYAESRSLAEDFAYRWLAAAGDADAAWLGMEMTARFKVRLAQTAQQAATAVAAIDGAPELAQAVAGLDRQIAFMLDRHKAALGTLERLAPAICLIDELAAEAERAAQHELGWIIKTTDMRAAGLGLGELPDPPSRDAGDLSDLERQAAGKVPVRLVRGPVPLGNHMGRLAAEDREQWRRLLKARESGIHYTLTGLALYWADGKRSVLEIADLVEMEAGGRDVELLLAYFELLAKLGFVTL